MFHHYKQVALTVLILMLSLSAGCGPYVENNLVEEIAPVTFWYFNKGRDKRISMSTLVPPITKEKKSLLTLDADLLKEGKRKFNLRFFRELQLGQLRMLFIHESLAKTEVISLINTIISDPDVSPRLYIVIVRGNFEEYLKNQAKKQENLDYQLYRMFRHYERRNQGDMTIVNLHQFMQKYYSPHSDPYLPVYKADKDHFNYQGTGFFKTKRINGTIKSVEDRMFQLLANDYYLKDLPIPSLSLSLGHVRSDIDVKLNQDTSTISIKVDIDARIDEYRGEQNLMDPKEFARIEKEIQSYLDENTAKLLRILQRWEVDPIEFGSYLLHPFQDPMSNKEWDSYWSNAKIETKCRLYLEPFSI